MPAIAILSALFDNPATRWWSHVTRAPQGEAGGAPWRLGLRDWGRAAARTLNGAMVDDFGIIASSIAFAAFLSILPLLSLVALTYANLVPPDVVASNIATLVGILPDEARRLVRGWLANSLARRDADGLALLLSVALTLFSARRAGRSLLHGINVASGIEQDRGTPARQITSLLVVLALAALLLSALVSITVLALLQSLVPNDLPASNRLFEWLLWGSLTLGPAGALLLIYRYAAAKRPIPWRWTLPGTLTAVPLWIGATLAFRFYVAHLASYGSTYGSLSAVVVLQLWLMLSAYILLLGARLNAEAMRGAGRVEW
ncbi:YihY/virulence factor BrkB family protein [Sphingomonas sp. ac-8]|uniref:YihY/virulence factor BrkB family protein n=1 Tax=Sphingomonas sp. ac-8 TaxID=3242977 RepID=UPI003A813970